MKSLTAIVSGRVQGVWFRLHTRDKAVELGVVGFVRNLPDGTVEIEARGEDGPVDALMEWARLGPPLSEVADVRIRKTAEEVEYASFEVRY
jgi:acylphosphatase